MNTWHNVWTITKRELAAYFTAPLAYIFLVIFLLLCGFFTFFVSRLLQTDDASLVVPFFFWHPWLYMFLVPAIGMRLWAEERRVGTIELLLTMPITPWQAIVGKFLASWLFLALALVLTFPMVIVVNYLGHPDNGVILSAYVGSWLMAGAYLAITCATSALTRSQVVSFIISAVICLILILAGFAPVINMLQQLGPHVADFVSAFSVMTHFEGFQKGILDTRDLIFFFSVIVFALFTTSVILRTHRAG